MKEIKDIIRAYDAALKAKKQTALATVVHVASSSYRRPGARMLEELSEKGIRVTAQQLNKIYGPVGLDLGAETSEEIALSVIAEIKAVLSEKEGGFLWNNNMPIHAPQAKILQANMKTDKATCEIKASF